jgi:hypothetical protein
MHAGVDLSRKPLPELAPALPNLAFMNEWLHEAREGGPGAQTLYARLSTSTIVDEMTEADGGCVDDFCHAITLLAAVQTTLHQIEIHKIQEGNGGMISGDTAPTWSRLLAALAVKWLSGRLLEIAERPRTPSRMGLAAAWLSELCERLCRRMLTARR